MRVEPINKGIPIHGNRTAAALSPKQKVDSEEFRPILDKEIDKLNASGNVFNIEQPKIVLAGVLGIINGVDSLNESSPKYAEETKAFGFDKIKALIEEALKESVIKSGRGQLR